MTIIIIHKNEASSQKSIADLVTRLESFGYNVASIETATNSIPDRDVCIQILPDPVLKKEPVHRVPARRGMIKSK